MCAGGEGGRKKGQASLSATKGSDKPNTTTCFGGAKAMVQSTLGKDKHLKLGGYLLLCFTVNAMRPTG